MADEDQTNQPNTDQPKPGETPDGSTVGPQPTPPGTDVNESPPKEPVVDTGPKAGPNSEGKVESDGVQTSDDLK